jgi:hypothetical protein
MTIRKVRNEGHQLCECCGMDISKRRMVWSDEENIACSFDCVDSLQKDEERYDRECMNDNGFPLDESIVRLQARIDMEHAL